METDRVLGWAMLFLFALVGVGLLLATIDRDSLKEKVHINPGLALFRFPTFRYAVVIACFIMAAVAGSTLL